MDGTLDLGALEAIDDDGVHAALEAVPGIGRWTSTIYLLMVLGRPDVWPTGDIALATAVAEAKGLPARPDPQGTDAARLRRGVRGDRSPHGCSGTTTSLGGDVWTEREWETATRRCDPSQGGMRPGLRSRCLSSREVTYRHVGPAGGDLSAIRMCAARAISIRGSCSTESSTGFRAVIV
jgi:hypothetical protein